MQAYFAVRCLISHTYLAFVLLVENLWKIRVEIKDPLFIVAKYELLLTGNFSNSPPYQCVCQNQSVVTATIVEFSPNTHYKFRISRTILPKLLNTVDHSTTIRKMYSLCSDCNTELMSLNFYETMGECLFQRLTQLLIWHAKCNHYCGYSTFRIACE